MNYRQNSFASSPFNKSKTNKQTSKNKQIDKKKVRGLPFKRIAYTLLPSDDGDCVIDNATELLPHTVYPNDDVKVRLG